MHYLILLIIGVLLIGCGDKEEEFDVAKYDLIKVINCGVPPAYDSDRAEEYYQLLYQYHYNISDPEARKWIHGYLGWEIGIRD